MEKKNKNLNMELQGSPCIAKNVELKMLKEAASVQPVEHRYRVLFQDEFLTRFCINRAILWLKSI